MSDLIDNTGTQVDFKGNPNRPYPRPLPNATACLVLGICSIVVCLPGFIMGIIGVVLHKKDKALYESDPLTYEASFKTSRAGYICSVVGICLSSFVILFYVVYFIFIFTIFSNLGEFR